MPPDTTTPDGSAANPAVASCLRILAAAYPTYPVREWRYAQQGWDSLTLMINDDTIFRFARRPDVAVRLAREAALLPALSPMLPLPIPHITFVGADPSGRMRFVGYPALPGQPLAADYLASPHAPDLAREFGAFLTALHQFPAAEALRLGVPGGGTADWRGEYRAFYDEIRERVFPLLTADECECVAARWEAYLDDDDNFTFTPALIHRDLAPEHILHDPAAGHVTGVIDWGDATVGDPAIDVTGIARELGDDFAERVLAAYHCPIEDSFRRRVHFYGFAGSFHEIRFGQYESDDRYIQSGLTLLRASLHESD